MIADFLKVSRIFIFFGPVAYFRSSERSAAGWANILTFSDRAFFPSLDRPHRTAAVIASKGFGTLHRSPSFSKLFFSFRLIISWSVWRFSISFFAAFRTSESLHREKMHSIVRTAHFKLIFSIGWMTFWSMFPPAQNSFS